MIVQKQMTESALREFVELIEAENVRLLMLHMMSQDVCACSKTPHSRVKNTAPTSEHGQQRIADLMRPTRTSNRTTAAHYECNKTALYILLDYAYSVTSRKERALQRCYFALVTLELSYKCP